MGRQGFRSDAVHAAERMFMTAMNGLPPLVFARNPKLESARERQRQREREAALALVPLRQLLQKVDVTKRFCLGSQR